MQYTVFLLHSISTYTVEFALIEALWVPQKAYTISASGRQVLPQTLQAQKAAGVNPGNSHSQRPKAHLLCQPGAEVGHRWGPRTPA